MVDIQQRTVVGIEVGADFGMDAGGTLALLAAGLILALHAVHVGTRSTQIAQIAFEIGHLYDLLHFAENALLTPVDDKLALMSRDCTEGTSAKTSTVYIDREFDHVKSRDALALVLGVWQTGVG